MPLTSNDIKALLVIFAPSIKAKFGNFPRTPPGFDIGGAVQLNQEANFKALFYDAAAAEPADLDNVWQAVQVAVDRTQADVNPVIQALIDDNAFDLGGDFPDFSTNLSALDHLIKVASPLINDNNRLNFYHAIYQLQVSRPLANDELANLGLQAVLATVGIPQAAGVTYAQVAALSADPRAANLAANNGEYFRNLMSVVGPLMTAENQDAVMTAITNQAAAGHFNDDARVQAVLVAVGFPRENEITVAQVAALASHAANISGANAVHFKNLMAVVGPLMTAENRDAVMGALTAEAANGVFDDNGRVQAVLQAVGFPRGNEITVAQVTALANTPARIAEIPHILAAAQPFIDAHLGDVDAFRAAIFEQAGEANRDTAMDHIFRTLIGGAPARGMTVAKMNAFAAQPAAVGNLWKILRPLIPDPEHRATLLKEIVEQAEHVHEDAGVQAVLGKVGITAANAITADQVRDIAANADKLAVLQAIVGAEFPRDKLTQAFFAALAAQPVATKDGINAVLDTLPSDYKGAIPQFDGRGDDEGAQNPANIAGTLTGFLKRQKQVQLRRRHSESNLAEAQGPVQKSWTSQVVVVAVARDGKLSEAEFTQLIAELAPEAGAVGEPKYFIESAKYTVAHPKTEAGEDVFKARLFIDPKGAGHPADEDAQWAADQHGRQYLDIEHDPKKRTSRLTLHTQNESVLENVLSTVIAAAKLGHPSVKLTNPQDLHALDFLSFKIATTIVKQDNGQPITLFANYEAGGARRQPLRDLLDDNFFQRDDSIAGAAPDARRDAFVDKVQTFLLNQEVNGKKVFRDVGFEVIPVGEQAAHLGMLFKITPPEGAPQYAKNLDELGNILAGNMALALQEQAAAEIELRPGI